MYVNPRETLQRLKYTAIHAPSAQERELALQLYIAQVEQHTKPTVKNLEPVVIPWP